MNKLSVLMSVYNDQENVENAIKSILNQTFEDFEFLIIDDCSTDDTYSVCNEYLKSDERIKLSRNEENIGLTKSLNILVGQSSGIFIARQDSDDISYEDRLMAQYKELLNSNIDGCTTLAKIRNKNRTIPGISRYISPRLTIKYKNPFIHGTLMIKAEELLKIGLYDENFYFAQDYKLMKDLIRGNKKIKILNKVLYELNIENNISTNNREEQSYYANCVKKDKNP
tara:strand:- start:9105 stop:9782 length:678 start_codon:yes stop_codon:yes gene_type:complete